MSYCVNCGVELDSSLDHCPLCNTPVINPNELKRIADAVPPFPEQRGEVDTVKRRDFTLLIGIILTATEVIQNRIEKVTIQLPESQEQGDAASSEHSEAESSQEASESQSVG